MLSTSSPTQGPHLCVKNGDFNDSYNGQAMHFAKGEKTSSLVQIDHVVAVQDAWASGLWQSSRAGERIAYYNDPDVLQAADQTSNEAKGAGVDWDASSSPVWLPDNVAWHCDYMVKRAYIKHKYQLTMSQGEKNTDRKPARPVCGKVKHR